MSDIAIKVEGLGKKYIIGHQKVGDFRASFAHKVRNLFSRNGNTEEEFWALKDVSFEIKKGEAVGIIGRNGAGKSTLLKVLSRITDPSTGRFSINGRVSSLLEVGTGFHPELSGRENIYLNGTILGMRRAEIKSKFDEIVEFSGVEKFIDTPVKHYSSGMKVRLAFSVAAHLEPEILIIDEVLAVGDAEFQKKCLGKMDEVSKTQGRTILFVSHNLAAVKLLCSTGLLIREGLISKVGPVNDVVHDYIAWGQDKNVVNQLQNLANRKGSGAFRVESIRLMNKDLRPIAIAATGAKIIFEVRFDRKINKSLEGFRIDFALDNEYDFRVAWFSSSVVPDNIAGEFQTLYLEINKFPFGAGTYRLTFHATTHQDVVDYIHQAFSFEAEEGNFFGTGKSIPKRQTFIYIEHSIASMS